MDFVTKLPRSQGGNNMIWVIVDRLTKSARFLHVKEGLHKRSCLQAWSATLYHFSS